jgi:hypothetical protein
VWRCDQIIYTLNNLDAAQASYPQCFTGEPSKTFAAVFATTREGSLGMASAARVVLGMALWTATVLHILGVEIYVSLPCSVRSIPPLVYFRFTSSVSWDFLLTFLSRFVQQKPPMPTDMDTHSSQWTTVALNCFGNIANEGM